VKNSRNESDGDTDEVPISQTEPVRAKRPWWLPHFLGRVPMGLDSRYVSLVGLVALAGLFENYDLSVLSAALKQIRESFGLDQSEMTSMLAWVRLGAIPAFLILPLADRVGRRPVFLAAVIGMSFATVASGFAQTPLQFLIAQTISRTFVVAIIATAVVIIAEELPAEHRGWGIGMLGAIGALGYGLGALLYAFVDSLPFGWRSLYMVGGLPLLLVPMLSRRIPETGRFIRMQQEQAAGAEPPGFMQPMLELLGQYPARSFAVAAMALSFSIGAGPAFGLLSDFVQTTHEWSPGSYSLMAIVAGAVGIIGNPAMGWAADRSGRRPVAMIAFGLFPIVALAFWSRCGNPRVLDPLRLYFDGEQCPHAHHFERTLSDVEPEYRAGLGDALRNAGWCDRVRARRFLHRRERIDRPGCRRGQYSDRTRCHRRLDATRNGGSRTRSDEPGLLDRRAGLTTFRYHLF